MADRHRANYALCDFQEHLGEDPDALGVPWAEFAGDESSERTFQVPTDAATDPYLEIQAYGVESYGHEIEVNGQPLPGFDLPPVDGWQYWMNTIRQEVFREGTNTLRIRRNADALDEFVVGTVTVHWREPVD